MMKKMFTLLAALLLALSTLPGLAEDAVRVAALKGPTGMAISHMMAENDGTYAFTLAGAPQELNAMLIAGQVDIAALPINAGAVLYNKTEGSVRALSLITRGMLYILEKGDSVHSAADLAGKKILSAGQGATPEYVLNYILDANGVKADVEYKSEHAEVTTLAAQGLADLVMLPEPQVTSLLMKAPDFRVALDITEEFAAAARKNGEENARLSMSVVVVRTAFLQEHPDKVAAFLSDLEASIAYANTNVSAAAQEIAAQGILPSAAVAEKALPSCTLVFIAGEDMRAQAAPLYDILFKANPASVGGKTPDDAYYVTEIPAQ